MTQHTKKCRACGEESECGYRCDNCGRDLAGDTETAGFQE